MATATSNDVGCERPDGLLNIHSDASTCSVCATVWYRYQETRYSGNVLMLSKSTFPVLKETAAGVWLDVYGTRRFVRADARKRFACPTEQEALESYHARKRRQVRILRAQLASAETALSLTKDGETAPTMLL